MLSFYTRDEAVNHPNIPREQAESIVSGAQVYDFVADILGSYVRSHGSVCLVALDGFIAVEWETIVSTIRNLLRKHNLRVRVVYIGHYYKQISEIERMVASCLNMDLHFGSVFKGRLRDFFWTDRIRALRAELKNCRRKKRGDLCPDVVICYGTGAAIPLLRPLYDLVFYIDITREEVLKRLENGKVFPLGLREKNGLPRKLLVKRLYYVDYEVLRIHKRYVFKYMDWYIEGNIPEYPILLSRNAYDKILSTIAKYPFRLKPIYIPRIWGGQYLKKIRKLPKSIPACAFSLEVIPSEQNVRIAVGSVVIEIPFLNLVWHQPMKILGIKTVTKFGRYFPLTASYDDTYKGGNLAIQVHPHGTYMKSNFNEMMRHDESYYVVKAWTGAKTYHGLREGTELHELYALCARAEREKMPFDHDLYVNSWHSRSGDLFLIPAGTVHASGANQLVLELDMDGTKNGTEYTFHLYDYLRTDLDGNLRTIHLNHAFNVIRPHRRTNWVANHLRQSPILLRSGRGWTEHLLGRERSMCYEVRSLELEEKVDDDTRGQFHILSLVEGESVLVKSQRHYGRQYKMNYTETIVVPACFGGYSITNSGGTPFCRLIKMLLN